jgi:hypothetical protein
MSPHGSSPEHTFPDLPEISPFLFLCQSFTLPIHNPLSLSITIIRQLISDPHTFSSMTRDIIGDNVTTNPNDKKTADFIKKSHEFKKSRIRTLYS